MSWFKGAGGGKKPPGSGLGGGEKNSYLGRITGEGPTGSSKASAGSKRPANWSYLDRVGGGGKGAGADSAHAAEMYSKLVLEKNDALHRLQQTFDTMRSERGKLEAEIAHWQNQLTTNEQAQNFLHSAQQKLFLVENDMKKQEAERDRVMRDYQIKISEWEGM